MAALVRGVVTGGGASPTKLKVFGFSRPFLNPDEPFRVPSQLRDQVAEFESEYGVGSEQLFADPDPVRTYLYE